MEEVPWYVSFISSWLPFLFLIGLMIWITRTIRATLRTTDGRPLAQVVDDHAREMRRLNELLEQAVKGQRLRVEAPEQKS
jgi:hypothetical protein